MDLKVRIDDVFVFFLAGFKKIAECEIEIQFGED